MVSATEIFDIFMQYRFAFAGITIAGVSLLLLKRWFAGGQLRSARRADGTVAVVTGANCGIGLQTAIVLCQRGATVLLACRSLRRAAEAEAEIRAACGAAARVQLLQLDLGSLSSVRHFAAEFAARHSRLDLLVNNAGIMACPEGTTQDGFEVQFGVNHLGHFLLTNLLLPLLRKSEEARVVSVSSMAHYWGKMHWDNLNLKGEYSPFEAYSQSKLANVLFTKALAERMKGTSVTAYSLHPGAVRTNLSRHMWKPLVALITPVAAFTTKSASQGAQTSLHCALAPLAELHSGGYYSDCRRKQEAKNTTSMEDAERLWRISEQMVGLASADQSK